MIVLAIKVVIVFIIAVIMAFGDWSVKCDLFSIVVIK